MKHLQRKLVKWALRRIIFLYNCNASYHVLLNYGIEDILSEPNGSDLRIIISKNL